MEKSEVKLKISSNTEFMKALKTKVNIALDGRPGKDNSDIYKKAFIILLWMAISYSLILFTNLDILKIMAAISLGVASAGLGFNLFHDANHGSLSMNKKVNQFFAFLSSSILGAGSYFWKHKHNYLHHQFPNIQNWDDDLETREGLRLSPSQEWKTKYKYQHIYAPLVYGLTTIEWLFVKDYIQYFSGKMNQWQAIPKMKLKDHFEFWVAKIIYYFTFVIIPLSMMTWSEYIIGFIFYHFAYSLTLASIFQLAHVMEETEFPQVNEKNGTVPMDWAQLQLATTVNFATKNRFITWFAGGLNYQVEHHIFPNISHVFYPKLAPILEETCNDFDYPYNSIPKYSSALKSHMSVLKKLGYHGQKQATDLEEYSNSY